MILRTWGMIPWRFSRGFFSPLYLGRGARETGNLECQLAQTDTTRESLFSLVQVPGKRQRSKREKPRRYCPVPARHHRKNCPYSHSYEQRRNGEPRFSLQPVGNEIPPPPCQFRLCGDLGLPPRLDIEVSSVFPPGWCPRWSGGKPEILPLCPVATRCWAPSGVWKEAKWGTWTSTSTWQ